jgi:hypothetical protein
MGSFRFRFSGNYLPQHTLFSAGLNPGIKLHNSKFINSVFHQSSVWLFRDFRVPTPKIGSTGIVLAACFSLFHHGKSGFLIKKQKK